MFKSFPFKLRWMLSGLGNKVEIFVKVMGDEYEQLVVRERALSNHRLSKALLSDPNKTVPLILKEALLRPLYACTVYTWKIPEILH